MEKEKEKGEDESKENKEFNGIKNSHEEIESKEEVKNKDASEEIIEDNKPNKQNLVEGVQSDQAIKSDSKEPEQDENIFVDIEISRIEAIPKEGNNSLDTTSMDLFNMIPKNLGTEDESDKNNTESKKNKQEKDLSQKYDIILLKEDPIFKDQGDVVNIQNDLKDIIKTEKNHDTSTKFIEIKQDESDVIDFEKTEVLSFFSERNFILSEDSKRRLNLLFFCIKFGYHILIPGPTGTGKTYLSEAICNFLGKTIIKYNCSENTKFPNLKFTCQGDKNKFAGIKYIPGPLLEALTTENTAFLLDEANLAPIETLQALEALIDSGFLVYEEKGKLIKIEVPKGFCMILTLNPSKGKFSGTRQELPESFKNKFISIEFPEMKKEELYAIAEGSSRAFKVDQILGEDNFKKFISDFISFHMKWSKNEKIQDDVACLVIRDILAVLHIIKEGEDPTETIMNIYGSRYVEDIKKEMEKLLFSYESFTQYQPNYDKIKKDFPKECFINKNTLEFISTCVFSLKHGRHLIIAGNSGIGKKELACQLGDYYNEHIAEKDDPDKNEVISNSSNNNLSKINKTNKNEEQSLYIVYCTKSSKVEDLMGKPKVSNNKNEDLIQWQDGPLIKAVREGKPLILIGIHELQSSVLEYMNDLLDRKYDGRPRYLNNLNNPNEPKILIHKNFRLMCTTLLSDINKLSPAFATRMDIKILNDQLEGINEEDLKELTQICMNNVKLELLSYEKEIDNKIKDLEKEIEINKSMNATNIKKEEKNNLEEDKKEEDNQEEEDEDEDSNSQKGWDDINLNDEEENNEKEENETIFNDEIKLLEKKKKEFDVKEIDEIVNNIELASEIIKYYEEYNKNNELKLNMTNYVKFLRSTILFLFKIKYKKITDFQSIVKLVFDLLFSDQSKVQIDEKLKEYILNEYLTQDPENKYFFHKIPKIENYMISLYLYCTMNIHIYVFGPPGVGKTAGAECLARIRNRDEKWLNYNYKKYAFNSSTNPSDIYGAETLIDGQIKLIDGPLTESALKGLTFIADEMNLSSNSTMMSLLPIFNTIHNRPIYFPGLQTPIKINPNFWFGAFQNLEGTAGRNATPHELSLKLIRLDYPIVNSDDIKSICSNIKDSVYKKNNIDRPNITEDQIRQLAEFMIQLNSKKNSGNLSSVESWSIRNLENIINRMSVQQKCTEGFKSINYQNCELWVNVLFYVLSYINFESCNDAFDQIAELIAKCFNADIKELKETYDSKPELSYDYSSKFYSLKKNKSVIKFKNSQIGDNINFYNKISSLLNTLFSCLLCADTEPILLIGPSGYKTYLVSLLVKDIKIITLNEESSIEALLGSTGFFTKEEVKAFYLSLICDVCSKSQKSDFLRQLKNRNFDIKALENNINNFFDPKNCEKRVCFKKMVETTKKKFLEILDSKADSTDNILNNIRLEFKPGLFVTAILSGESLDLRNFDKIPTTTLERFNELFTGMKTLTLNEDKFNTITTQTNKILCDTVDFIRFFATSLTKNFSEAVLSRWTVINAKEYEFEELKEVLRICLSKENLNTVKQNDIEYLIEVARFFKSISNKTVSIKLLINAIELYHNMNIKLGNISEEDKEKYYYKNRQFIFYVTLKSIIEQSKDDRKLTEEKINSKLKNHLFQRISLDIQEGKNPFSFEGSLNRLKSSITNLSINCLKSEFPENNPEFTNIFIEMINIIHLGLSLNAPVVLEGNIGQGKQTAIKYVSELLGLKLLNIQLASSTKEEDLLGKIVVDKDKETNATIIKVNETDLMNILRNKTTEKYLIVFNDIQNASDAVKEKIANICDKNQKKILLPNGDTPDKPPALHIICVINTENNSDIRSKLPSPLLYSTIYHKIGELSKNDITNTTKKIFKNYFKENAEVEAQEFLDKYFNVNQILIENKSRQLLTFNDINNYAKLRAATINSLDIKIIDNMIFYYRAQEEEIMSKIKEKLHINGFDFTPKFEYNTCHTELSIRIENQGKKLPLSLEVINKDKIDTDKIKRKINTLSNHQKQCLLFLACAWKTKSKVIIKGDTASGKTHCAILFSEMLGADLLTYQMNQDLTPSIFTGQSILEEDLNESEINMVQSYLSRIKHINYRKNSITTFIPKDSKKWSPTDFNTLFGIIDEITPAQNEENKKLLIETKSKINCIISPQGRFKEAESQTSKGLINGSWFLYDDIQYATEDLLSIMTPLCSDKPSLNLFNAKGSPKYTSELIESSMSNVKLIHRNFNLIMTFNPKYCKNYYGLDPILENKCLSFHLPQNDIDYESSAQIIYGNLINSQIKSGLAKKLGGKLANVHMLAKRKSLENKELFEGDTLFTSRTINRVYKIYKCQNRGEN